MEKKQIRIERTKRLQLATHGTNLRDRDNQKSVRREIESMQWPAGNKTHLGGHYYREVRQNFLPPPLPRKDKKKFQNNKIKTY